MALGLVLTTTLFAQQRGYSERACGFDLNDNGIRGETEDCRVCDGATTDPDGDGIDEDLIYVDCDNGTDEPTCGGAGSPCKTLDYALNTVADGHADNAEDIVCFRGTCSPANLTPGVRGVAGHRVEAASGSQAREWQYPTDPAMIVGWDSDQDGAYPPFDSDDLALLDGGPGNLSRAFRFNRVGSDNSYFELAHFTARDYNRAPGVKAGGFLKVNDGQSRSHLYIHDLSLIGINQDQGHQSGQIVFDLFASTGLQHLAVENIDARDVGGYIGRGSATSNLTTGPFRFSAINAEAHGCDHPCTTGNANFTGFKVWGWVDGFELLDSRFDCNHDAWSANICQGAIVAQCLRDAVVRNNEFLDASTSLRVAGSASGFCEGAEARSVDQVVFDRNLLANTRSWRNAPLHIELLNGGSADGVSESFENVQVTNNMIWSSATHASCLHYNGGNQVEPQSGKIVVANNTCIGDLNRSNFAAFNLENQTGFPHQDWQFENNIVSGMGPNDQAFRTNYAPSEWHSDFNVFQGNARFRWNRGDKEFFEDWQTESGGDQNSNTCIPEFVDATVNDYHLTYSDDCARDRGIEQPLTTVDFDGERREPPWDVGADEMGIGANPALELRASRFRVGVQWNTLASAPANAEPIQLTDDSGYYWFFDSSNVELVVKVLDACAGFDRYFVFASGLTNVGTAIRVEDTLSGQSKTYFTQPGQAFQPILDSNAFETCP